MELVLEHWREDGPGERPVEIVERKGRGHPDSICDAVAEALSRALSQRDLERHGRILHHNVDKALLVGGRASPRFGGGRIEAAIGLILAGRACVASDEGAELLDALGREAARGVLRERVPLLDFERDVAIETRVRPGSLELVELFGARPASVPLANDTSCGVGHAPLSELESLVSRLEPFLSRELAEELPALGPDVKVMALRRGHALHFTLACALVGRHLQNAHAYRELRTAIAARARDWLAKRSDRPVSVAVNAADDDAQERYYVTVTGTSAEAGDDGQPGRGNRVNGLIAPGRPTTLESVAGKNPVNHVGKLYNVAAGLLAHALVEELPEIEAAECRLVSRIGSPITEPEVVDLRLRGADPREPKLLERVREIAQREIEAIPGLWRPLLSGEIALDRWPLRAPPG